VVHEISPTARALLALEAIQNAPGITAQRLGERLGVTERAARRYVAILREAGLPIESVTGPYGGYQVGYGMRLPPLSFNAAEAAGLVMAVLEGHRAAADPADLVGGALAKIIRVLPARVSALVRPIRDVTTGASEVPYARGLEALAAARVSPELTTALFEACAAGRRLHLRYRLASQADAGVSTEGGWVEREMDVDPWAVILRHSRWYLLCWSHTRDARRVLRVDRIASAAPLPDTFTPPPGLDPPRLLEEHLSQGWKFPVDVLIDAPPAEVAGWLPPSLGALSPAGDGQTRLLASTENPDWYAGRLAVLPYGFRVTESAPLRDALAELARRLLAAGADHPGTEIHELSERRRLTSGAEQHFIDRVASPGAGFTAKNKILRLGAESEALHADDSVGSSGEWYP
jgi:predicted DNA-binding transcriptional regulator YafY